MFGDNGTEAGLLLVQLGADEDHRLLVFAVLLVGAAQRFDVAEARQGLWRASARLARFLPSPAAWCRAAESTGQAPAGVEEPLPVFGSGAEADRVGVADADVG